MKNLRLFLLTIILLPILTVQAQQRTTWDFTFGELLECEDGLEVIHSSNDRVLLHGWCSPDGYHQYWSNVALLKTKLRTGGIAYKGTFFVSEDALTFDMVAFEGKDRDDNDFLFGAIRNTQLQGQSIHFDVTKATS